MNKVELFDFQKATLERLKNYTKCGIFHTMGLGKTFTGAEKAMSLLKDGDSNVLLIVCQKSKIDDWYSHMCLYYLDDFWCYEGGGSTIFNLTKPKQYDLFLPWAQENQRCVGIINYDLVFRRKELLELENITLLLDESSMIQNEKAKRTKAILKMDAENVVLLSGTPVGGKYEHLWSQCKLLGWNITKSDFWRRYIQYREWRPAPMMPPIKIVTGYQNVDDLKLNLRMHGADFLKSEEVLDLPEQVFQTIKVKVSTNYKKFMYNNIITVDDKELVGDNPLKKLLYARMLCGAYNKDKLQAFKDWVESNNERLIVFYNFDSELEELKKCVGDRPVSVVNGHEKDLTAYENESNSITLCQYQAAAMGLNLQKARYLAYYSLPLSSELFEQSKKRIHRIGQKFTCFYYTFLTENSVEEKILDTLNKRNDYTLELFKGI